MPLVLRVSRFATGTVVVLLAGACQAWKVDQRPVSEVVQDHRYGKVALTTNSAEWIVVSTPMIQGDSVVGIRTGGTVWENNRTAILVAAVRSVKTRQFGFRQTVGLLAVIALLPLAYQLAFVEPEE